jgi:hypothetical protein
MTGLCIASFGRAHVPRSGHGASQLAARLRPRRELFVLTSSSWHSVFDTAPPGGHNQYVLSWSKPCLCAFILTHLVCGVLACNESGPSPREATFDDAHTGVRSVCEEDLDCFGGSPEVTFGPIGSLEPLDATCLHVAAQVTPVCECRMRLTPTAVNGRSPYEVQAYPGNRPGGCSEWSFPPGCLYCESEFPGCSVDDPRSCDAVCADMFRRFEAQSQRVTVATARLARCSPDKSNCQAVTQIEGHCYAGPPSAGPTVEIDCNLSDDELIAHLNDPPVTSCAPAPAIPCATASDCPRGLACSAGVCGACSDSCAYFNGRPDLIACEGDVTCASGELCTLGRCIPTTNISCRAVSECGEQEACVLSGFGSEGRGNTSTRSFCQPSP